MVVNDPIADMLTRIRNGQVARHDAVTMPASNTKKAIAKILLNEGYVKAVDYIDDGLQGEIKITLKYMNGKQTPVIAGLKRISKPGLRVYARSEELPKVLGGLGIREQLLFPEIEYDKVEKIRGMEIVFVTTAKTDEECKELLKLLGMPFEA